MHQSTTVYVATPHARVLMADVMYADNVHGTPGEARERALARWVNTGGEAQYVHKVAIVDDDEGSRILPSTCELCAGSLSSAHAAYFEARGYDPRKAICV